MGVRDGDRERIGRIGGARVGLGEQEADHGLDLMLLGMAHADHCLLDEVCRVFGDRKPEKRRDEKRDATRMAKLERGACILADEGFLDGRFARRMLGDDCAQPFVQLQKPLGKGALVVARDDAAGDKGKSRPVHTDYAPAGSPQAGVEADQA